jgi:hypothetical protein
MINWCGSFAIAGCCNFFWFWKPGMLQKRERPSWGMMREYDSGYDSGVWFEVHLLLVPLKLWTHQKTPKNTYPLHVEFLIHAFTIYFSLSDPGRAGHAGWERGAFCEHCLGMNVSILYKLTCENFDSNLYQVFIEIVSSDLVCLSLWVKFANIFTKYAFEHLSTRSTRLRKFMFPLQKTEWVTLNRTIRQMRSTWPHLPWRK